VRRGAFLLLLPALSACGGGEDQPAARNDSDRVTQQIENQAAQIARQTENGAAAIEQALENEQAILFENRGNLLNEAAPANSAAPASPDAPGR